MLDIITKQIALSLGNTSNFFLNQTDNMQKLISITEPIEALTNSVLIRSFPVALIRKPKKQRETKN
jgi:hypothetical protein